MFHDLPARGGRCAQAGGCAERTGVAVGVFAARFLDVQAARGPAIDLRQLAERHWTFAHAHGLSLGRVAGTQLAPLAQQVLDLEDVNRFASVGSLADIHVWEPAASSDIELGTEAPFTPLCDEIEKALRAAAPESCARLLRSRSNGRRPTARGGLVLDVVDPRARRMVGRTARGGDMATALAGGRDAYRVARACGFSCVRQVGGSAGVEWSADRCRGRMRRDWLCSRRCEPGAVGSRTVSSPGSIRPPSIPRCSSIRGFGI